MKHSLILVIAMIAIFACSHAQSSLPHVVSVSPKQLAALKASFRDGSKEYSGLAKKTIREADRALKLEPLFVTIKTQWPEGGSKHDYVSLAPYWWPDPTKQDGLPYIRKDGEVNPERELYKDRENFRTLAPAVSALGAAYYVTGDERYADHATRLIGAWFLDSATSMNPSLNFAQAIRGRNTGRGAGLIEMHMLPKILDAIGLIEGSKAWDAQKRQSMIDWCADYYTWLTTSEIGRDELDAPNNHGSWYDVQRTAIALFIGRTDDARRILEEAKTVRIASQIEPDGRQPKELVRTKSMGYSTFNLLALSTLGTIGSSTGVDLWHFSTSDGRSIKKAIDYMIPFYTDEKPWKEQQIVEFDTNEAVEMLLKANVFYEGAYDAAIAALEKKSGKKQ